MNSGNNRYCVSGGERDGMGNTLFPTINACHFGIACSYGINALRRPDPLATDSVSINGESRSGFFLLIIRFH